MSDTKTPTVPDSTEIWKALFNVQQKLDGIVKDSTNPHFKNSYADRTTVLQTIKPLFAEEGLLLVQAPVPPPVQFTEPVLALATSIIHVATGQQLTSTAIVPLPKADPQGYGSATTYTSRYSLTMLLGLPLLDDDGNAGSGHTTAPASKGNASSGTSSKGAAKDTKTSGTGSTGKTSSASTAEKTEKDAKQDEAQTSPSESKTTTGTKPAPASGGKRKLWGAS